MSPYLEPCIELACDDLLKAAEGCAKIGTGLKGDGPLFLDHHHHANQRQTREHHEKEGTGRCRSLHTRMTVNQHGMTSIVFPQHLVGDLWRPGLHVFDFGRLKIVIDRYPILMRYQCAPVHEVVLGRCLVVLGRCARTSTATRSDVTGWSPMLLWK